MHSSEVGPFVSKIRAVINDIGKHSRVLLHSPSMDFMSQWSSCAVGTYIDTQELWLLEPLMYVIWKHM